MEIPPLLKAERPDLNLLPPGANLASGSLERGSRAGLILMA